MYYSVEFWPDNFVILGNIKAFLKIASFQDFKNFVIYFLPRSQSMVLTRFSKKDSVHFKRQNDRWETLEKDWCKRSVFHYGFKYKGVWTREAKF